LIRADVEELKVLERQATWRALRIGVMLNQAKTQLPHGAFAEWVEMELNFYSAQHLHRFAQLAEVFIRSKKLQADAVLLLLEAKGTDNDRPEVKRVEQLAFDFLGDDSMGELFTKYAIRGGMPVQRSPGERQKLDRPANADEREALTTWQNICAQLHHHGLDKKTWLNLPNDQKVIVLEMLDLVRTEMRNVLKNLPIAKRG
jgi:hypothetical protein